MPYAEVSVNSPIALERTFSYAIPEGLKIAVGQAVWVPFGAKVLQGIVIELTSQPAVVQTRDIAGLIDPTPLLTPQQVELARWLSRYYLAPLFECVALMLPPAFERKVITFFTRSGATSPEEADLKPLWELIPAGQRVDQKVLEKRCGVLQTRKTLARLVRLNAVTRSYELENERIKPRLVTYVKLLISSTEARRQLSDKSRLTPKMADLISYLIDHPEPQPWPQLIEKLELSAAVLKTCLKNGWVEKLEFRVNRDPLAGRNVNLALPLPLTDSQKAAFLAISQSLQRPLDQRLQPDVFLLFGVTGSGKTEVYLQALAETVKLGRQGIVLVPEISMTPQIIERFISRFPGRVAVLHSQLTLGEQFDEWWQIKKGEFDVVIGPRSALFAPQPDLGLIILDEEHEWSYKQADRPHYHARQAALKLAELSGATLVLGSATPDIESFWQAGRGKYQLLELPQRVTTGGAAVLPEVEIVDLKVELKAHNLDLFSRSLHAAILSALQNQEQIILFLNRRGGPSFIECRNCGMVIRCARCETPLSYHFNSEILVCHRCNYRAPVPQICPRCHSPKIKYLGAGTEKLEQAAAAAFPQARIIRWDSDSLKEKGRTHQSIFEQFRSGQADILIGTQMIAKGLDLPRVTLVGVVSADVSLNLPDFRAEERTFQLLCQVAGRAGRGTAGGRVIIQTYTPENYAIQFASGHNYRAFYERELEYRRQLRYPPFSRLARLVYSHTNEARCQAEVENIQRRLADVRDARGLADVSLIGPAPAFLHRLRGKYRWQLLVRAADPAAFLFGFNFGRGWSIDIDPYGLA
jgi:primosomal protein N' (replication factor Y) (superfamily II helicase)